MQETLEEWIIKLGPENPQTISLQKDVEKLQKQNSDIHQLKDKQSLTNKVLHLKQDQEKLKRTAKLFGDQQQEELAALEKL
eukprot:9559373-Karenia_brevis.AAC.1